MDLFNPFLIIEVEINFGKLFQEATYFISLISSHIIVNILEYKSFLFYLNTIYEDVYYRNGFFTFNMHRLNKHLTHKLNSGNYCVYWCHYYHRCIRSR